MLSLLLGRSLADGGAQPGGPPPSAHGAPDEDEAAAAALLLRGVCLLDARTRAAAAQLGGVELLLARAVAAAPAGPLRPAALDALAALLADAPAAQAEFTRLRGAKRAARRACIQGSIQARRFALRPCGLTRPGAGAAQVAALVAPPAAGAPPAGDAAALFLILALEALLEGDAQRSADEAVRAALGPDAPARLAAAAATPP